MKDKHLHLVSIFLNNKIGDKGANEIGEGLKTNNSLIQLNIS